MGVKSPSKDTAQVLPSQEISVFSLRQAQLPAGVGCDVHPTRRASMDIVIIINLWILIIFWVRLWWVSAIALILPAIREGGVAKLGFV